VDRRWLLHDPGTATGAARQPAGRPRRDHAEPRPEAVHLIFRVAEFTILTGFPNLFASGRGQELTRLETRWSWAILAGIILAVGVYAMTRATIARWAYRLVEIGPLAASGDAAAAAQMPLLGARIRRFRIHPNHDRRSHPLGDGDCTV
jgi:hypothetical protein